MSKRGLSRTWQSSRPFDVLGMVEGLVTLSPFCLPPDWNWSVPRIGAVVKTNRVMPSRATDPSGMSPDSR